MGGGGDLGSLLDFFFFKSLKCFYAPKWRTIRLQKSEFYPEVANRKKLCGIGKSPSLSSIVDLSTLSHFQENVIFQGRGIIDFSKEEVPGGFEAWICKWEIPQLKVCSTSTSVHGG